MILALPVPWWPSGLKLEILLFLKLGFGFFLFLKNLNGTGLRVFAGFNDDYLDFLARLFKRGGSCSYLGI